MFLQKVPSLERPPGRLGILCWPQTFNELLPSPRLFQNPSLSGKAGAKVQPFCKLTSTFFIFFSKNSHHADCQDEKFSGFCVFFRFWMPFPVKKGISGRFLSPFFGGLRSFLGKNASVLVQNCIAASRPPRASFHVHLINKVSLTGRLIIL